MHAIAFETDVRQGIIRIPLQYRTQLTTHVKVILLQEEHDEQVDRQGQAASFELASDHEVKKLPNGFSSPLSVPTYTILADRNKIYER